MEPKLGQDEVIQEIDDWSRSDCQRCERLKKGCFLRLHEEIAFFL